MPEDYPDWFRRRRYPFFGSWFFEDIDRMFREMERMMEEEFRTFSSRLPKDYVKERKLPDGTTIRELGPFVYGYSVKIGPDGKPEIREFGNVKPSRFGPRIKEEREPLVDVVETDSEVHVVAELPGVEKTDIKLHGTEDTLTISVDTPQRKYYKEVKLPAKVNVKEAKTAYKNGVLEVTLPKVKEEKKPKGEPINIE
ncbi:Hsp20/alpha crystallin family protein [Candidatus Bathyarchaeota archaeon]|nr:Hsp20/alpha crystallin family protein [Candidatus Bathyarchaeota archaeon]RJS68987.1 MAG: Hsp20/alpha crystallin family protein [Candidatus Bathyarchaeota archaeon]RLI12436.1 MAG: Hsp20/alpha crystallin family protein [Candidatus Bathyarchaeota archaeon]RLI15928.1 MAG: Hsp20/alpha crystallin family protein [Candidatus Bathyarchaeota archaeon]